MKKHYNILLTMALTSQQKKQINREKNFFHSEKFEDFSLFPGKGTALDEKKKDDALTDLLMDLTRVEQMPADHVTPEKLAKMYSQLEYEFGFMVIRYPSENDKRLALEKKVLKTLDCFLSYNQCATEWTSVIRKKTRKKQYANPLLRLVVDYLH